MPYKNKETVKVWLAPVSGNPREITIPMALDPDSEVWTFATCKDVAEAIGGNCQFVEMYIPRNGIEVWVDEEGMMHRQPLNPFVCGMCGRTILGAAVILIDTATPHGMIVNKMLSSATTGSA